MDCDGSDNNNGMYTVTFPKPRTSAELDVREKGAKKNLAEPECPIIATNAFRTIVAWTRAAVYAVFEVNCRRPVNWSFSTEKL